MIFSNSPIILKDKYLYITDIALHNSSNNVPTHSPEELKEEEKSNQ